MVALTLGKGSPGGTRRCQGLPSPASHFPHTTRSSTVTSNPSPTPPPTPRRQENAVQATPTDDNIASPRHSTSIPGAHRPIDPSDEPTRCCLTAPADAGIAAYASTAAATTKDRHIELCSSEYRKRHHKTYDSGKKETGETLDVSLPSFALQDGLEPTTPD